MISLHHINIKAPATILLEVRDFYCSILGLEQGLRPAFKSEGYWLYSGELALIHLTIAEHRPSHTSASTLDHIAYTCHDFSATCTRLDALGLRYECNAVPEGSCENIVRQIFLSDPAGNGVELIFPI